MSFIVTFNFHRFFHFFYLQTEKSTQTSNITIKYPNVKYELIAFFPFHSDKFSVKKRKSSIAWANDANSHSQISFEYNFTRKCICSFPFVAKHALAKHWEIIRNARKWICTFDCIFGLIDICVYWPCVRSILTKCTLFRLALSHLCVR